MATANFAASIAGVVAELVLNRVHFLIVGGTAAAFHGYIDTYDPRQPAMGS